MRRIHSNILWMVTVTSIAACGGSSPPPPPPPQQLPGPALNLPPEVLRNTWEWVGFRNPLIQERIDASSSYTIEFDANGRVAIQADCNRGTGTFTVTERGRVSFGPIGVTRAMCPPGSMSDRFVDLIQRSTIYFMQSGDFFLELPADSGTLQFRRQF